jgi:ABC-type amino acid transport substrate-binding protein
MLLCKMMILRLKFPRKSGSRFLCSAFDVELFNNLYQITTHKPSGKLFCIPRKRKNCIFRDMKKNLFFFLLVWLTTESYAQKGDSWAKINATGSGTIAVLYYEQPGLIAKMPDGSIKGVCVDILFDFVKHIEAKRGKKVTIHFVGEETEFPRFLSTVQNTNNLLGVTNTSITDERKKVMKFTPAFMNNEVILLTNRNVPTVKSLSEISSAFKGFTAQVITGSTHAQHMEKIKKEFFPDMKIESIPSGDLIIKNMSTNPKIFSIIDFTEYIGVIKKRIPIKKHDVDLGSPEELAFIMSKQSDWDEVWKEFLTPEYRKSVRYKEIIAENLGSSFLSLVR